MMATAKISGMKLARQSGCSRVTVRRYLRGEPDRPASARRIRAALADLGALDEPTTLDPDAAAALGCEADRE